LNPARRSPTRFKPRAPGVAVRYDERETILNYLRVPADHRQPTYSAELMHHDAARYERAVFDLDVARQRDVVGYDDAVAQAAVVSHVRVGHQKTVRAHDGFAPLFGPAMQGDAFAYLVSRPDYKAAIGPAVAHVLRLAAQDCAFINHV
jgi:hypothetical protein